MNKSRFCDQYLALSRKWYKMEPLFLWSANTKPCPPFRMVHVSMTWVTSNSDSEVTILFNVKKQLETGTRLHWQTNRKWHAVFQTAPLSMTLNPNIKVMPFFAAEYLTNYNRYNHTCYKTRIGKAFELYHFKWPAVTDPNIQLHQAPHSFLLQRSK